MTAASTLLTTDDHAPRERAPLWREWIWKHFNGLESDLYGDTQFDGRLVASHAGDVVLTRLEASRHRVLRTPGMARGSETAYLKIVAPWQGSASVEQDGREASVRAGGWTLYDTTGSYTVSNPERSDHLIVMLPKARMALGDLRLADVLARRVGGASGISRVALETMRSTYLELPHMSEASARGAGELIMQLVHLSLMELAGRETGETQREALRDRIRQHVMQNLRDPRLSIEGIAQALGCSKRTLHGAFAGDADTLAGYILRLRISACVREFESADARGGAGRPITDIALDWGFSSLSHFSRVFREHTGMSPSEFRQRSATARGT